MAILSVSEPTRHGRCVRLAYRGIAGNVLPDEWIAVPQAAVERRSLLEGLIAELHVLLREVPQREQPNAGEPTVRTHIRATILRTPLLAVNIQEIIQIQGQTLELCHHCKDTLTRRSRSFIIVD